MDERVKTKERSAIKKYTGSIYTSMNRFLRRQKGLEFYDSYERDEIVEVNRSNFIIWNSEMEETIEIEKTGSQIDVLPTLLNLFGIEYDSRLIVGKDILSTYPGLAIFSDRSWVYDKGTYFSKSRKFVPREGESVDEEYIKNMNIEVANRFSVSGQIINNNIYKTILGE